MKKYALFLLALFAMSLLTTSCEEDIEKRQVTFTATMPSDDLSFSRLGGIINGLPAADGFNLKAQWKDGDKIQVFVRQDGKVYQVESPSTVSGISSDGKTCSFMVTLPKSVNRDNDYEIVGVMDAEVAINGSNIIGVCNMKRVGVKSSNKLLLPMWFTAKKGSNLAKFRHMCAYEILYVNNVSGASITFKHSGFETQAPWYRSVASILLSDGRVGGQIVQDDVESDEITIPAGETGTIVSWYVPIVNLTDVSIDNARLKAAVNGNAVVTNDLMTSYKTFTFGSAYYMQVTWDGSALYFSNEFCPDSNHPHIIDLGLPSGTKWACCNVGTNIPTECGNYFAWGETSSKSYYAKYNYKWFRDGDDHNITKYCCNSNFGTVDNRTELEPEDDAACVNWGPEWRMPSLRQFYELKNNCATKWTNVNGMGGYLFKSNTNGKAVFLPAAGWPYNGVQEVGSEGFYWSCRYYYDFRPDLGEILAFGGKNALNGYYYNRYKGASVRPVYVGEE